MNRQRKHDKTRNINNKNDPQKKHFLGTDVKTISIEMVNCKSKKVASVSEVLALLSWSSILKKVIFFLLNHPQCHWMGGGGRGSAGNIFAIILLHS